MWRSFLLTAVFVTAPAFASNAFPNLSMEELVSQSDIIASGKVVRSWAEWDPEHRFLWTHNEIRTADVWKGKAAQSIIVSEPGGELNGRVMRIAGAAAFKQGEQVNVFLYRTPIGYLRTTNYGQGKIVVGPAQTEFRMQVRKIVATQREVQPK